MEKRGASLLLKPAIMLAIGLTAVSVGSMPPGQNPADLSKDDRSGLALFPEPTTIDRIIQSEGNIVTTVDNWGLVGGYPGYLPSGEWPRNSGHDYLAEIRYWMGAVTAAGDTLVANTYDDFQAMLMPVSGVDKYRVYLSTDSSRYYDYDPTDTVGAGDGHPAYGWRIWDAQTETYEYNTSYNPLSTSFVQGGATSLQDSHYRFNDAALGTSLMGLELTHTAMQWNYCYNEDFIFFELDITNTSAVDYTECAFGLYVDIDVGGLDGTGGNGNMEDSVTYFPGDDLAYIFDVVGIDPGWGPTVQTGIMGTKLLETPGDVGMTAFCTGDWSYLPDDDPGRFEMINSTRFDDPLPPTDQYYVQCARGFDLPAGSTVRMVYALIAGEDSTDFVANAEMAQTMYDNNFVGPQPPPTPTLRARAGDEKIYLNWGDTSEVAADPLTGENDFAGYKLYRSDDLGRTWGAEDRDNDNACLELEYVPVALHTVSTPGDPIPHSFIDDDLINGVEYWYCLVAFDLGDETIDPLQSGFGVAGQAVNVISIRPESAPAGYYEAATTVEHIYNGDEQPSDGEVIPVIFDENALLGTQYSVVFEDDPTWTYWHLINNTTGDTILADQTLYNGEPEMYELAEGVRVVVQNPEVTPPDIYQSAGGGAGPTLEVDEFSGPCLVYWYGIDDYTFGYAQYRATYELRYTDDSTLAPWMWEYWEPGNFPKIPVPFEVWNLSTNQRVSLANDEWNYDGQWQPGDGLIIVDYPYDPVGDLTADAFPYYYGWRFTLVDSVFNPADGDVLTIEGAPLNGPDDIFTFALSGINSADAANQLNNIRVVPNPYFVQYSSRVETAEGESVLYFDNLPARCTIRIYTLAGDLVRTIEHDDDSGAEQWNLLSSDNQQVASGLYLYHVESEYGEHLGRFAVIK
ncbi:MAG: hypothetical protein JSW34_04145 [Candidatus Zixiibacteriota bacterium]|nr:MAG: hypothetical protein JSW34_04145 [candidate division Zixibacteria bacterium]